MNFGKHRPDYPTSRWVGAIVLLAIPLTGGCQAPRQQLGEPATRGPGGGRAVLATHTAGTSAEGRPMEYVVIGQGSDVVLMMATIHGNEPAGTPLLRQLAEHLADRPELVDGRCVVLLPVANPDGMARQTRGNAQGVDLNRNFPALNFAPSPHCGSRPLSEPETVAISSLLQKYRPARIVTLHQPAHYGRACVDYDGPAKHLAQAMAAETDLPLKKLGGQHGSLGSYAGITLGIPVVTVELPKVAHEWDESALWARYGDMLLAAVRFPATGSGDDGLNAK